MEMHSTPLLVKLNGVVVGVVVAVDVVVGVVVAVVVVVAEVVAVDVVVGVVVAGDVVGVVVGVVTPHRSSNAPESWCSTAAFRNATNVSHSLIVLPTTNPPYTNFTAHFVGTLDDTGDVGTKPVEARTVFCQRVFSSESGSFRDWSRLLPYAM